MYSNYSIAELRNKISDIGDMNGSHEERKKCESVLEKKKQYIIDSRKHQCMITPSLYSLEECSCLRCGKSTQVNHGNNIRMMSRIIGNYISLISQKDDKPSKIIICEDMFTFIAENCKPLIITNHVFERSVRDKLMYLYYDDDVKEAYGWYRRIFQKRMPFRNVSAQERP